MAAEVFHVKEQFRPAPDFHTGVKGEHARERMLAGIFQTVRPAIESGKSAVALKNEI